MSAFSAREWADVEPIAQDDGPLCLVPISVSMEFQEVHGYLRALLKRDEVSERALTLTAMAIEENAANHLTWQHRRRCLLALESDLQKELEWVARLGADSPKNYQIWHHRRQMVESLGSPGEERKRTGRVLERDNKNYHCWTYRKWLCHRFDLWEGELAFVRGLLVSDVRNNSAWTHRWLVLKQTTTMGQETLLAELEYTRNAITRLPGYETNESAWNYLLALLSSKEFQAQHALVKAIGVEKMGTEAWARNLSQQGCVQATAFLCDFFSHPGASKGHLRQALLLCVSLAQLDPQKRGYWSYRRQQIKARLVQDSRVFPFTLILFAVTLISVIVRLLLPTFVPTLVAVLLLCVMLMSAALSFLPDRAVILDHNL